jgi:hypothetical protein
MPGLVGIMNGTLQVYEFNVMRYVDMWGKKILE